MVDVRPAFVDLSELRHRMPEPPGEEDPSLASDLLIEGKLRTRYLLA
jgi:hypothetical protein